MPFADRPQAEDEALLPGTKTALVRGGDDGRIGERCRLDRILVREVGTDEEPLFRGQMVRILDQASHSLVVALQCAIEVGMPLGELGHRGRERRGHVDL